MTVAIADGVRHGIAQSSLKRGSVKALTYGEKNARQEEKFEHASWEDAAYSGGAFDRVVSDGLFNGRGKRENGLLKDDTRRKAVCSRLERSAHVKRSSVIDIRM